MLSSAEKRFSGTHSWWWSRDIQWRKKIWGCFGETDWLKRTRSLTCSQCILSSASFSALVTTSKMGPWSLGGVKYPHTTSTLPWVLPLLSDRNKPNLINWNQCRSFDSSVENAFTLLGRCFSNFSACMKFQHLLLGHLGILLKCRFPYSRSGEGP